MLAFCHIDCHFDHRREISGAIEVNVIDCVLVGIDYTVKTVYLRAENVSVHSEAMGCSVVYWRHLGSKTKGRNVLVRIIVLKNRTNRLNSL